VPTGKNCEIIISTAFHVKFFDTREVLGLHAQLTISNTVRLAFLGAMMFKIQAPACI